MKNNLHYLRQGSQTRRPRVTSYVIFWPSEQFEFETPDLRHMYNEKKGILWGVMSPTVSREFCKKVVPWLIAQDGVIISNTPHEGR